MKRTRVWLRRSSIALAAALAAAVFYSCWQKVTPRPAVAALLPAIDEVRLRAHVARISAFGPHPEANEGATAAILQWLGEELAGYGYTPQREPFDALMLVHELSADGQGYNVRSKQGVLHHNLIVERRGRDAGPVLEVGAHYDSVVFGPGADDNGSGVAALLETARVLATASPRHTVRFLFYAMEEEGLVGSAAHVKQLTARGEQIAGAIVLDMVGYRTTAPGSQKTPLRVPLLFSPPDQGDFLVVAGNFASGWLGGLYEACADAYVPDARYYSVNRIASFFEDAVRSDHSSYWAAGMHAILLTDTAEMRNPNYHRATDTPDTIDYAFLVANTRALAATVLHWAGVQ